MTEYDDDNRSNDYTSVNVDTLSQKNTFLFLLHLSQKPTDCHDFGGRNPEKT